MPFESDKQRKFLYANKPKVAKKFAADPVKGKRRPKKVEKKTTKRKKR